MSLVQAIYKNVPNAQFVVKDGVLIQWDAPLPAPTDAQVQQWYTDYQEPSPRIAEIKNELAALDIKRIRPVAEGDTAFLTTLNAQAVALRAELQGLL